MQADRVPSLLMLLVSAPVIKHPAMLGRYACVDARAFALGEGNSTSDVF